jgi:predicted ribosome quality control (RQC) complex YloA/Tae2 family protein
VSLNLAELQAVVAELQTALVGARLDKLHAIQPGVLQLVLQKRVLIVSLEPGATRLHLVESRASGPPSPPAWVMKARAELLNLPLASLELLGGDRVVRLVFEGRRGRRALVAELFGRAGRLLLLDEQERILHPLLGQAERGAPYAPTPRAPGPQANRFPAAEPDSLAANRAVAAHYQAALEGARLERLRRAAARPREARQKRLGRRLAALDADLGRIQGADLLSRQAEALKHGLASVPRGAARVWLPDPFAPEGPPVEVHLDPALEPAACMNRLFSRARRLRQARPGVEARLAETRAELAAVELELRAIAAAHTPEELPAPDPASARPPALRPRGEPARRQPCKRYRSAAGREILVGRSGRDNHTLTFRLARGSDLWLHARDAASAHVLLRLGRDEEPDEQSLLDAASLAAWHSPLREAGKVEVLYTRAKHVHPIKGAPPGLVSAARTKTFLVRLEPARLQRLERSREST